MRKISFGPNAFEQFVEWGKVEARMQRKIGKLIDEAARDPFSGTGKPEPLRHDMAGFWARRITDEHRLVYRATEDELFVASCKHHYEV